jgi:hypothetical protein
VVLGRHGGGRRKNLASANIAVAALFDCDSEVSSMSIQFALMMLPEDEQEHMRLAQAHLYDLERYVERFRGALSLMDYAAGQVVAAKARDVAAEPGKIDPQASMARHRRYLADIRDPQIWRQIAARDAALTIWDFLTAFRGVKSRIEDCPTFRALMDMPELNQTESLCTNYFPNAKSVRHGAAHPSDVANTLERNAFTGGPIENGQLEDRQGHQQHDQQPLWTRLHGDDRGRNLNLPARSRHTWQAH